MTIHFTVKTSLPTDLYNEYVRNFLQNPKETPVIQLGQAAILADYLVTTNASPEAWFAFANRLRPDITGIIIQSIDEKSWPEFLRVSLLPEIKELAGLSKDGAALSREEPLNNFRLNNTQFSSRVINPFTKTKESPTPYLHTLLAIYTAMTDEQRTKYFGSLLMRNNKGSPQVSINGRDWQEFFGENLHESIIDSDEDIANAEELPDEI